MHDVFQNYNTRYIVRGDSLCAVLLSHARDGHRETVCVPTKKRQHQERGVDEIRGERGSMDRSEEKRSQSRTEQ